MAAARAARRRRPPRPGPDLGGLSALGLWRGDGVDGGRGAREIAAAVLVLIDVLMVVWFRSFLTPLIVMVAIPFSLVGILPAHGALNAFFTATSMIGFMAGEVASLLISRLTVPVLYFMAYDRARLSPAPPPAPAPAEATST